MRTARRPLVAAVALLLTQLTCSVASAELGSGVMVPAVAGTSGQSGTFWRSDVSLHNPHRYDLPVVIHFLETGVDNSWALTAYLTLYPWETFNLWDVLGPDVFDVRGTGAVLVYADPDLIDCSEDLACDLLVGSRTYTVDPRGGVGEFGQAIGGRSAWQGVDWWTFGYAAGILNDGVDFRCNVGVASWSAEDVLVHVDVQSSSGEILATEELRVRPFGHRQRRLATPVGGGSLVFYLVEGPDDALIYPYASVVDERTGDPSFIPAEPSEVGVAVDKARRPSSAARPRPATLGEALVLEDRTAGRPKH